MAIEATTKFKYKSKSWNWR